MWCAERTKILKRAELVILDGKGEASEDAGIELGEGSVVNGISVTGMGKYDGDSWNKHFQENNFAYNCCYYVGLKIFEL